jgi:hypothetical protein
MVMPRASTAMPIITLNKTTTIIASSSMPIPRNALNNERKLPIFVFSYNLEAPYRTSPILYNYHNGYQRELFQQKPPCMLSSSLLE